jgi:uncharacterized cysteine cluster protein YcgN (CxxCxxCC family)
MSDAWWDQKPLSSLSEKEWESLCDHCGKCCLLKLEDEDSSTVYYTNVACYLLEAKTCQCTNYQNREILVPDCLKLTPDNLEDIQWMPLSCAYRRIMEGRGLPEWHHLVCNDINEIHHRGCSVVGKYICESRIDNDTDDLEEYIVEWPILTGN